MKAFTLCILILVTSPLLVQSQSKTFDIRLGAGYTVLELQDDIFRKHPGYEMELNYKLNTYFTSAFSLNSGKIRKSDFWFPRSSFHQENINLFFSPFKNNRTNDLRIGAGLSFVNTSFKIREYASFNNDEVVDTEFTDFKANNVRYNFALENTYSLTKRFMVGLKLFTFTNFTGEFNHGIFLKTGYKLNNKG